MPKIKAKLTEAQIKNAKPKASAYKLYDEGGLLLLVRPTGTKVWQYPYRVGGKYNICTIGQYPEVGSAEARRLRDDIKRQVKAGDDPNRVKKASQGQPDTTFEAVGWDW